MEAIRTITNDVLLGEIKDLLAEGHRVILRAKGVSMLPFVRSDVDSLELERRNEVAVGDIVLAHLPTGHYVAHRVIGVNGSEITLKGDGNLDRTETCQFQDICGTAVRIIRPRGTARKLRKRGVCKESLSREKDERYQEQNERNQGKSERYIDCSSKIFLRLSAVWRSLPRLLRRGLLSVARRVF